MMVLRHSGVAMRTSKQKDTEEGGRHPTSRARCFESGTEVESNAGSSCRGSPSSHQSQPSKNCAELQGFSRLKRAIQASIASKRRLTTTTVR